MALDFSSDVYAPCVDLFGRAAVFTPRASQPGAPNYTGRGIFSEDENDVMAENGSIVTDSAVILDILEVDFPIMPQQRDLVFLPADPAAGKALGPFEITDVISNGGGETTLRLRDYTPPVP